MKRLLTFLALCCLMVTGAWAQTKYLKGDNITSQTSLVEGDLVILNVKAKGTEYYLWFTNESGSNLFARNNYRAKALSVSSFEENYVWEVANVSNVDGQDVFQLHSLSNENAYLPIGDKHADGNAVANLYLSSATGYSDGQTRFAFRFIDSNSTGRATYHFDPNANNTSNGIGVCFWGYKENSKDTQGAFAIYKAIETNDLVDVTYVFTNPYNEEVSVVVPDVASGSTATAPSVSYLSNATITDEDKVVSATNTTFHVSGTWSFPFQESKYYTMKSNSNNYVFDGTNAWYNNSVAVASHNDLWQFEHVSGTLDLYKLKTYSGKYAVLSSSGRIALTFADTPTEWESGTGATSYFRVVAQNGGFDLQHPGDAETNVGSHVDGKLGSWKAGNSPTNGASINKVEEVTVTPTVIVPSTLNPASGNVEASALATITLQFTGEDVEQQGLIPTTAEKMGKTPVYPTLTKGTTVITATSIALNEETGLNEITFPTTGITDGEWILSIPEGAFYTMDSNFSLLTVAEITATYTVASTGAKQITDLTQLSNDKAYVLICGRGQLSTSDGKLVAVAKDREDAYAAETNKFAIIKSGDKYYLWSVAEEGYVRTDKDITDHRLAAQEITLTHQDDDTFRLKIAGKGMNMQDGASGIIINDWVAADPGNKYAIYEVDDFADAEKAIAAIPGWSPTAGKVYTIMAHFTPTDQDALYLSNNGSENLQFATDSTSSQSYWIAGDTNNANYPWNFQSGYGDNRFLSGDTGLSTSGFNFNSHAIDATYSYLEANLSGIGKRYVGTWHAGHDPVGFGKWGGAYGQKDNHSDWTTYYAIEEVPEALVYHVTSNKAEGGVTVNMTGYNGAATLNAGAVVVFTTAPAAENLAPKSIEGFTGNITLDTEAHTINVEYGHNYTVVISGTHASEAKVLYNGTEYANEQSFFITGALSVEEIAATYFDGEYAKITIDETNSNINVEYRSTENAGIYNIGASTQNILPGKWYIMTQTRGGETPVYNNGVNTDIKRAGQNASTVLAPATKFTGVADKYLIRFTEGDYEGTYQITFADGGLWNGNQVKATAGNYLIKPAVNTTQNKPGLAINVTNNGTSYGQHLDNNGANDRVVLYSNGAYTSGTNDVWYIYPVELDDVATVTYLVTNPYGEEVAFTETAFVGASPVAPQINWLTDPEISDAKTIVAGENTFHVTGTWVFPFEEDKSYTMRAANSNNFIYNSKDAAYCNNSVAATNGSDIWQFEHVEGTLDLYTVKNEKAGYVTVASSTNQELPTYEETPTAWAGDTGTTSYFRIVPNGNGFDLQHPGDANANLGNHVGGRLGIWNASSSATGDGSRILVTEVTEATYTLAFGVNAPEDAKITYAGQDYTNGGKVTLMGVFHPAEVVSYPDTYRTTVTVDELSKTVGIDFILKKDYTVTITGVPENQTATLTYAGTAYNTNDVIHADATLSVNELTATVISGYSPKVEIGEGTITVTYRERKYTVVVTNADNYGDEVPALKDATISIDDAGSYGDGDETTTYADPLTADRIAITSGPDLDWMDKSVRVDESNLTINVYQKLYHPLWRLEELPTDGTPVMVFDASIERDRSWKGFHYAEGTKMKKTKDIFPLLYAGTLASVWTLEAGPDENTYYLRNEATGNYHNYTGNGYASREESGYLYIIDFPSSTVTKQTDEAHVDNFYGEQIGLAKDDIGEWTVGKTKTGNVGNSNWNGQEEYFVSHTHSSAFAFYSLKELTPTLANDSIKAVCLDYAEYFDGANGKGHDYGTFGTRVNDASLLTTESTFTEYCNIILENTARTIKAPAPGRLLTIVNAYSAEYMDGKALTKERAVMWFNSKGQLISWNTGKGLAGANEAAIPAKEAGSNGDELYQPAIDPNTGTFVVDDDKANSGVMGTMVIRTTGDDGIYYSENNNHVLIAATEKNNTSATWFVDNADYVDITIPASGYTTLYAPVPMQVPEGVTAYTIATEESLDDSNLHICTLILTELENGIIPAGTAVVLAGESGAARVDVIYGEKDGKVDESTYADIAFTGPNDLKGYDYTCTNPQTSASNGAGGKYIYTLSSGKFQYYTGSTIKAFKCFLELEQDYRAGHNREGVATNPFRVIFNEGTTGISSTRTSSGSNAFDLSGRRINVQSERGLYILNGKKVIR